MDITTTSKQEFINKIISSLIAPSNIKSCKNFTEENDKLYNSFISKVKHHKFASVKLPVDYVLKYELFSLLKEGSAFIESSSKFVSTITTSRPTDTADQTQYNTRFTGNEFSYSFLDNHPGILNVDHLKDIPKDYEGLMAVPVTVLEYRNINDYNIHRVIYAPKHRGKLIYPRIVVSNKFAEF